MKIKLIPSEEGSGAFIKRGTPLRRIALAAGDEPLGLWLPRYESQSIGKLISRGLVSTLELESADFLQTRAEIQDLCKAVGTAAIFQSFNRDVTRELERLQNARRGGTDIPYDERNVTVLRALLAPLRDGKRSRLEAAAELLKSIPLTQKRQIHTLVRTDSSGLVMNRFRELLRRSADRTDIPEYLALVVLELVNSVQIQTMHEFALRTGVSEDTIHRLFQDADARARIRTRMEQAGETNAITWSFSSGTGAGSRTTRMSITMTGSGTPMRATSAGVQQQRGVSVEGKSLKDFYEEIAAAGGMGIDLGLYYLSYLEKLCRQADIRFETQATELRASEKTMIGIRLLV